MFFFLNSNYRACTDGLCPSGRAAVARLHGRGPATGGGHRSHAEARPAAGPAALGRAAESHARPVHRVGRVARRRRRAVRRRGLDRAPARPHRLPVRHPRRGVARARRPEPQSVLLR